MAIYRHGLYRGGLFQHGLYRPGLVLGTDLGIFDRLKDLSEQLIVASEGDDPSVTGRYPQQGHVASFDGSSGYTEVFDNEVVPIEFQTLSDDIIIEAYINADVVAASGAHQFAPPLNIVELRQLGSSEFTKVPFSFGVESSNIQLGVAETYPTATKCNSNTTLSINTPYHIKVVISGDDYEFFLNGVSDGSGTFATSTGDRSVGSSLSSLTVGCRAKDSGVRDSDCYDGRLSGVKISKADGTVILQLNLDESSGTVAIDANDATNNGTLINGVTRVVDNTLPYSALNQVGYTEGTGSNGYPVGVNIPASTVTPTKDAYGNTLQHKGLVYPVQPVPVGSYAVELNGSTQSVTLPVNIFNAQSSGSSEAYVFTGADVTAGQTIFGVASSAAPSELIELRILGGYINISVATDVVRGLTTTLLINTWYKLKWESTGSEWKLYVNDVPQTVDVVAGANVGTWFDSITSGDTRYSIGTLPRSSGNIDYFEGGLSTVCVRDTSDNVLGQWNLAEGVGPTIHDTSGNGNGATIINGTTGTEGAGSWGGRQNGYHLPHTNWKKGFTLYLQDLDGTSFKRVPYVNGAPHPSPEVTGYTFVSENPAVFHPNGTLAYNNAETTFDAYKLSETFTAVPESVNLANFETITFDQTNSELNNVLPIDTAFRRDFSTVKKDRLIVFYDTLTGDDLQLALRYVNGSTSPALPLTLPATF